MINLLPPQRRASQQEEQRFRLLVIWGITLLVFFISLGLFLSMIRIYLGQQLVAKQTAFVALEKKVVREDVLLLEMKAWNATLKEIEQKEQDAQSVVQILRELTQAMPEGLQLASFSFTPSVTQKKKDEIIHTPAQIAVTGRALTRKLLFSFRERLQEHALFESVNFPPQNWVSPQNIDFTFQATIHE